MQDAALRELSVTNRIFEEEVVGKGDFAALDRVYTTDARILPPGAEMVVGIAKIRAFWKQAAADLGVTSVKLETVEARFLEDTAVEIGRAKLMTAPAGEVIVKYVVVWKRESGRWKWDIDIWNGVS